MQQLDVFLVRYCINNLAIVYHINLVYFLQKIRNSISKTQLKYFQLSPLTWFSIASLRTAGVARTLEGFANSSSDMSDPDWSTTTVSIPPPASSSEVESGTVMNRSIKQH